MGLLTELFVATEEQARGYDGASATGFAPVEFGGLTSLEFESLWAIVEAQEWSPDRHILKEVASGEEWGTFRFPAPYVERLRRLEPADVAAAATAWAATEEIAGDPADIEPVVRALVSLARSVEGPRGLYVWTSL
jgi:hypothetical protein